MRSSSPFLLVLTLVIAASAPPSMAATVSVDTGTGTLSFVAAPGETNSPTINDYPYDEGEGLERYFRVYDQWELNLVPGPGCHAAWNGGIIICEAGLDEVTSYDIRLGDRNDGLIGDGMTLPATVFAGTGNDSLTGGGGDDTLFGQAGNDYFNGSQTTYGPTGADIFFGGTETDTVSYQASNSSVSVDIDNMPDDGAHYGDEHDNVTASVEVVRGSVSSVNMLIGDSTGDSNRDDTLVSGSPNEDEVYGLDGNDTLYGRRIEGGPGADTLTGTSFQDRLNGDQGADTILAGGGNDTVSGRDLATDALVDCGTGTDLAGVDAADPAPGCETKVQAAAYAYTFSNELRYEAFESKQNQFVNVNFAPGVVGIADAAAAPIAAGPGCGVFFGGTVVCGPGAGFNELVVELGDLADVASFGTPISSQPILFVYGGSGADTITLPTAHSSDILYPGPHADTLNNIGQNDIVYAADSESEAQISCIAPQSAMALDPLPLDPESILSGPCNLDRVFRY